MHSPEQEGQDLLARFENLLSEPAPAGRQWEQTIQDYLEENSELLPTPNLLNHGLHFNAVVSKFPLGTELITDYAYITKSSALWRIVFAELETPDKSFFLSDTGKVNTAATFNHALDQVRSWKRFVSENRSEVVRRLQTLLRPESRVARPIEFKYLLILGRSADKNLTHERLDQIRTLVDESGIEIWSYDTVIDHYGNRTPSRKNILRLNGTSYAFKYLHVAPQNMLSFVGPETLALSSEQQERLKDEGFDIASWLNGDLLTFNGRQPRPTVAESRDAD